MLQGICRTHTPVKQEFSPSCKKHQLSSILSGSLYDKKVACPNHENMTARHARLSLGGKPGFSPSCKKDQLSSILSGSPHVKKVVCPNHENMIDIHTYIYSQSANPREFTRIRLLRPSKNKASELLRPSKNQASEHKPS